LRFPRIGSSLAPLAPPHTLAEEFLSSAPGQVDRGIADHFNEGFYQKSQQFHSSDGGPGERGKKERSSCTSRPGAGGPSVYLSFTRSASHTVPMDDLEKLRTLVGPEAKGWTLAQLEQLNRDMNAMAEILLEVYRSRNTDRSPSACGLQNFDVQQSDR
jgi:hypothetical protein